MNFFTIMVLEPFCGPWVILQFLIPMYSRYGSLYEGSARRKTAPCTQISRTQNEHTDTSITQVAIKPFTQFFEWAKNVYAVDRAATLIGS
jgi:hypothetical protein